MKEILQEAILCIRAFSHGRIPNGKKLKLSLYILVISKKHAALCIFCPGKKSRPEAGK